MSAQVSVSCALALLLGISVPSLPSAAAQEAPVSQPTEAMAPPTELVPPPTITTSEVSLAEAVRMTVLHDPFIQQGKQDIAVALGGLQQAGGFFDSVISAQPSYSYTKSELQQYFKDRQWGNRLFLELLGEAFGEVASSIQQALNENDLGPPPCPEDIDFRVLGGNILDTMDTTQRLGIEFEDQIFVLQGRLAQEMNEFFNLCQARDAESTTAIAFNNTRRMAEVSGLRLTDFFVTASQLPREILIITKEIAEAVSTKALLAHQRWGEVPEDETVKTIAFDAGYTRPFRNGMSLRSSFRIKSTERNFLNKPIDPSFGGMGIPNQFPSFALVTLDVPLGKGRGSVSAQAPERAAELNVRARRERLRHTISEEVFGTVVAYLALLEAQESLSLLEESAARQERLVELTQQLVEADEVPRTEIDRAQARATAVASSVAQARLAILEGRFALANAVGLGVEDLAHAPLAADTYRSSFESLPDVEVLVERAVAQRRDLKAVAHLRDASRVLRNAARADLKRRFDLSVTGGMTTYYENPDLRYLPDEVNIEDRPEFEPVMYYSARGFKRAIFDGTWEPYIKAGITIDFPFANNVAKGRLLQEESSLTTSEIRYGDLERTIRDGVVETVGALERAAAAIEQHRQAIVFYEETLEAALARFEIGEISLVDMLLTEEELTQERLQLVRAMRVYLSILTRLRFELGDLVSFSQEGTQLEMVEFDATGFTMQ